MNYFRYLAEEALNLDPIKNAGANAGQSQINTIVNIVFGIAGSLALLFIVIGGLRYVLSQGDPNAVATAKNTVIYALVGLVVTITAYGIVAFVINHI
jgi:hypothetical protein